MFDLERMKLAAAPFANDVYPEFRAFVAPFPKTGSEQKSRIISLKMRRPPFRKRQLRFANDAYPEFRAFVAPFSKTQIYEISDLTDLQLKATGHVNDDPRYQITGIFKNGKRTCFTYFAPASAVGQIQAHLRSEMKGNTPLVK